MNVPLTWLSEYIELPKDTALLTDRLTMIGHMLDKRYTSPTEPCIDLELRGNRSDLFGLLGIARDISAAFQIPLNMPPVKKLPHEVNTSLVRCEAHDLVERFIAFTLHVTVQPSPQWLKDRLISYGIPSINNVVDITNYVMIETGEPMHAYDFDTLSGRHLVLRRAKNAEPFTTFLGTTIALHPDDLVIADDATVQGTAIIGGSQSRISEKTTTILLEAAVYHQGNVRRTARRHGIRTEAGNRHEKLLDSLSVPQALERALYLLEKFADAHSTSGVCDIYNKPREIKPISVDLHDCERLCGISIEKEKAIQILVSLACTVTQDKNILLVSPPSFRTDITESVDLVEEIIRIVGYEKIPVSSLDGQIPTHQTDARLIEEEFIRNELVNYQLDEVITMPLVTNSDQKDAKDDEIKLINAPDPTRSTLRPSLIPNLISYAISHMRSGKNTIELFEIGKVFSQKNKKYLEESKLAVLVTGQIDTKSWSKTPRELTYYDLKGVLLRLTEALGIAVTISENPIPNTPVYFEQASTFACHVSDMPVGILGKINETCLSKLRVNQEAFAFELSLDTLQKIKRVQPQPYILTPAFPPIIEDITLIVPKNLHTENLLTKIRSTNPLVFSVQLLDMFESQRTIRIVYQDPKRTLSDQEIKPIREEILQMCQKDFGAELKLR